MRNLSRITVAGRTQLYRGRRPNGRAHRLAERCVGAGVCRSGPQPSFSHTYVILACLHDCPYGQYVAMSHPIDWMCAMALPNLRAKMNRSGRHYIHEVARIRDLVPWGGRFGNEWPTCLDHVTRSNVRTYGVRGSTPPCRSMRRCRTHLLICALNFYRASRAVVCAIRWLSVRSPWE